jgi:small subunit ribosomal protein S6
VISFKEVDLNTYEGLFIIRPDLEEQQDEIVKSIQEEIKKREGNIKESKDISKKRFAYNIGKHKEGLYYLLYFEANPQIIRELKNSFKLKDSILRNLIIKKEG